MLRQQHRLAQAKKAQETFGYRLLMAIPRNLVYVFACTIVLAFLGMIYVVYTEKNLSNFLSSSNFAVHENVVVHPLFEHFKNSLVVIDTIPQETTDSLTPKKFYKEYLSNNIPVLVLDGCAHWPAMEKWNNREYLKEEFGGQSLLIMKLDKGGDLDGPFMHGFGVARRNNFEHFLNQTEHDTAGGRFGYYIKNELIVSKNLQNDYIKPSFITKVLRNRLTGITIWPDFPRKPEMKDRERYYCVLQGVEEFRIVQPIYKQNIYSGVLEELLPGETPLDFFRQVNQTQYPLFKQSKILSAKVHIGQCLFVPAYYWVQSATLEPSSMILNFEYESHSELSNLLFQAIDQGILED